MSRLRFKLASKFRPRSGKGGKSSLGLVQGNSTNTVNTVEDTDYSSNDPTTNAMVAGGHMGGAIEVTTTQFSTTSGDGHSAVGDEQQQQQVRTWKSLYDCYAPKSWRAWYRHFGHAKRVSVFASLQRSPVGSAPERKCSGALAMQICKWTTCILLTRLNGCTAHRIKMSSLHEA